MAQQAKKFDTKDDDCDQFLWHTWRNKELAPESSLFYDLHMYAKSHV